MWQISEVCIDKFNRINDNSRKNKKFHKELIILLSLHNWTKYIVSELNVTYYNFIQFNLT
jgi:hypothetical protein